MRTPRAYCTNPEKIKAFVLGCDPTAFDKSLGRLEFEYVFNLDKNQKYFSGIKKNLEEIGLTLNDIYVQNLITDYQDTQTGDNKNWFKIAYEFVNDRVKEFDTIDPNRQFPVFLTSESLLKVLVFSEFKNISAADLYSLVVPIPINPNSNLLKRKLIPLYRHPKYSLVKWPIYVGKLKTLLQTYQ